MDTKQIKTYEIFTTTGSTIHQAETVIDAIILAGNPDDLIKVQIADNPTWFTKDEQKRCEYEVCVETYFGSPFKSGDKVTATFDQLCDLLLSYNQYQRPVPDESNWAFNNRVVHPVPDSSQPAAVPDGGEEVKEFIVCSAIQYFRHPEHEIIVTGLRHNNCISTYFELTGDQTHDEEQGFLTSKNRFVNRTEAGQIALACGQIKELKYYGGKKLDSSDLYHYLPPSQPAGTGKAGGGIIDTEG